MSLYIFIMVSKGFIYKICIKDGSVDDIYIGSTTNPKARKHAHKTQCQNKKGKKYHYYVYQFIREHGGFENWDFIILEKIDNIDKVYLKIKERYYIENLKPSLNKQIPMNFMDNDTWDRKNYEIKYRENNRLLIREKHREQILCPNCGFMIVKNHQARHNQSQKHQQNSLTE